MTTLRHIEACVLDIGYFEAGPADGPVVMLMHGWPYDAHCYLDVMELLAAKGVRSVAPFLRGFGPTRFLSDATMRSGEQAAIGADVLALMDALSIETATLAGFDWGGRAACIATAVAPGRVTGLVSCGVGYNIQNIACANDPGPVEEEARYWYIYMFHTERGRVQLTSDPHRFGRFIWQLWSPNWAFDDATYDLTAASFENPDYVDIVIHSYRHRFGGVPGDPGVAHIEETLARQPNITVPTVILQGEDDTVDPPSVGEPFRSKFTSHYECRVLSRVGHNPPQEDPAAFAAAVLDVIAFQKL
ncbi:MAG: alpha/beta hydrolase [Pseudomonadota bacterium]